MFSQNTGIMLYIDDVAAERDFWSAMDLKFLINQKLWV